MKLREKLHGVILPALILLSVVLLLLITALVSSGTSGLRTTTLSQQSDVATYAAEAGLAEAVEEYRRAGRVPARYTGQVDSTQATYTVQKYENVTTTDMQVPGGPSIPPSTMYLLSEGRSPNGTREKVGGLFRTGLGVFHAGVVSQSMTADRARFDAYDSAVNEDPTRSLQPDRGILASNRVDPALTDPQYAFTDSTVEGGVFVAPGTTPEEQISKSGSTAVSREGTLASPITIDPVTVPRRTRGGRTEGGTTTGGSFNPATYSPSNWRFHDLKVTWNAGRQSFVFKDDGGIFSSSTVGEISLTQLQAAAEADPPILAFGDGDGRDVTIDFSQGAQGKFTYSDPAGSGEGVWNAPIPSILTVPLEPSLETENPDKMGPGAYASVTIDDDTPTRLEEGTYVIDDLKILGSGQLEVPDDTKVVIYVTGELTAEGENALVNTSRLPTNLKLYYTGGQPVNLAGGALSYLTLVAPEAEIKLEGLDPDRQSVLYGALVGKNVSVINAALHFDVATEGVGTGTDGSVLTLLNRHRL